MRRGIVTIMLIILTLLPLAAVAGQTDSPGDPASGSGMPTLQELYDYLTTGTEPTDSGSFEEPGAGPASTMKTLQEIYAKLKELFEASTARPDQVLDTETFLNTDPLNWGVTAGTIPIYRGGEAREYTPGSTAKPIDTGYHEGSIVQGDASLAPANIVAGVTIFDVTGTAPPLAPDPNLAPENIQCGVTIYGVTGTYNPRFQDNGDGTVTDNRTGLIWLKEARCLGRWNAMSVWLAIDQMNRGVDFSCDSYTPVIHDWRLPNINELATLVDLRFYSPTLSDACGTRQWEEGNPFTGVPWGPHYYWTIPPLVVGNPQGTRTSWLVSFSNGERIIKDVDESNEYYVWPVRSRK